MEERGAGGGGGGGGGGGDRTLEGKDRWEWESARVMKMGREGSKEGVWQGERGWARGERELKKREGEIVVGGEISKKKSVTREIG